MSNWDWAILFAIVAWVVYRSKASLMPEKVAFLYYNNVKPALHKFGFEGSSRDVVEEMNWIESLYYLEDFNLALNKTGFKNLELNSASNWGSSDFHVNNGELANIYTISFSTLLAKGRNKGILELSIKNQYKEKELGKFGTYITQYCAPVHYFNSTNMKSMLFGFF